MISLLVSPFTGIVSYFIYIYIYIYSFIFVIQMTKNILIVQGEHMQNMKNTNYYKRDDFFDRIRIDRVTGMTGHSFFSTLHIFVYITVKF